MSKKIMILIALGCGCGFAMVFPLFFGIHMPNAMRRVFEIINIPAIWFAHEWTYVAGFPPYDQLGAWLIVPSVMMLIQWSLAGFLVGLCASFGNHWGSHGKKGRVGSDSMKDRTSETRL